MFFPLMVAKIDLTMTKAVVVFIPPPVEPGDAPMKMIIMKSTNIGSDICSTFTMLNPAVRPKTTCVSEENNLSKTVPLWANVLLYSKAKKRMVPKIMMIKVVIRAICVPGVSVFQRFLLR